MYRITGCFNLMFVENLSLTCALEECLAGYYGTFKKSGIEPDIQLPKKEVFRYLNPTALSRILSNIVSNAAKYSDSDFSVRMDEYGTLRFINHAPGLDEIQVGHLFDRFYTVSSGSHSTGLGLSIAKTLTEEMHGHIDACCRDGCLIITLDFPPKLKRLLRKSISSFFAGVFFKVLPESFSDARYL